MREGQGGTRKERNLIHGDIVFSKHKIILVLGPSVEMGRFRIISVVARIFQCFGCL